MVRKIRVSRNGLTQCPGCAAHIKVSANLVETTCPFCEATFLSAGKASGGGMLRILSTSLMVGRSSLIAASLLGMAATTVGCSSDNGGAGPTDTVQDVTDSGPLPPYGIPPDAFPLEDTPEVPVDAVYGAPPDPNDP